MMAEAKLKAEQARAAAQKAEEEKQKQLEQQQEQPEPEKKDKTEQEEHPTKFRDIIEMLPQHLNKTALSELTVSFSFVCLLHLANEKGVKIDIDENGELSVLRPPE